jgi:two-component system, OmpR family, response regulator
MAATGCWQSVAMNAIFQPMNLATHILIVDDDAGIRGLIGSFLEKHGFVCATAANPEEMRQRLSEGRYDLIVLDVMMPREDGLTALRSLQKQDGPPVIMLSAVGTDIDRIVGLELGAEDYLAKPCNPRELLARIRSVLRRRERIAAGEAAPAAPPVALTRREGLTFAGWRIDLDARQLFSPDHRRVQLTDGEFRLLKAFVEHPRRVLTRDQLLDFARGQNSDFYDRAIDVQISRLRRKLADGVGDGAELIRTVRNEGYLFVASVTPA